jgi:hypothetical protein
MQNPAAAAVASPTAAAATVAAAAAERPPDGLVARLAGEVAKGTLVNKIGLAYVTWLWEAGLATFPPPPPDNAHVAASLISAANDDDERTIPCHVLRLTGEVDEDELVDKIGLAGLNWLWAKGLLTYPSPLLGSLLEKLPEVLAAEVLLRVDPADLSVIAQVGSWWLAAVVASGLPRAGKSEGLPLKLKEFCGSAERLAWARENGCPWGWRTCAIAAAGGHLEALKYARTHKCPWGIMTCACAARGKHWEVLRWARKHGCPCPALTYANAARRGHL